MMVPVPRVGNGGLTHPGHADSLWEGFLLQSALSPLLAVVNNDGVWPVVLCETLSSVKYIICQGFGKIVSFQEEWRKGVSYLLTLVP